MAKCPNGHDVPDRQHYCGDCGAAMVMMCPDGHENPAANRFCFDCGSPIGEAALRAEPLPPTLTGLAPTSSVHEGASPEPMMKEVAAAEVADSLDSVRSVDEGDPRAGARPTTGGDSTDGVDAEKRINSTLKQWAESPYLVVGALAASLLAIILVALITSGKETSTPSRTEEERLRIRAEIAALREDNLLLVCGLSEDNGYLSKTGERGYYGYEGDFPNADIYTFDPIDPGSPTLTLAATFEASGTVAFANCGY